jgi:hypothetical protein
VGADTERARAALAGERFFRHCRGLCETYTSDHGLSAEAKLLLR